MDKLKAVVFDEGADTGKFVLFRVINKSTGYTRHFVRGFDAMTHSHIQIREELRKEVGGGRCEVESMGGAFYRFEDNGNTLSLWGLSNNLGGIFDKRILFQILARWQLDEGRVHLIIESSRLK